MHAREKAARVIALIVNIVAVALIVYELALVWRQFVGVSEHYAIFFGAVFSIAVLMHIGETLRDESVRSRKFLAFKVSLLAFCLFAELFAAAYIRYHVTRLEIEISLLTPMDITVGLMSLAAICIATYFIWGWMMVAFIVVAVGYFLFGDVLPGYWGHQDYGLGWVISYTTMHPVFGVYWLIPLTADTIFYVLLVSAVLAKTGSVGALLELGKAIGARVTGGAAYPAVIGSGMVGMIVGQAVANVVITGRVTIPSMKKQGIPAVMAAGIESSASAGALIMPPIMGLGAFIMAFYLNVPYIHVALAAVIPAILYYAGVGLGVYFNARVLGWPRVQQPVDWHLIRRVVPTFVIGIGVLGALLLNFYSARVASICALLAVVAAAMLIQGKYRPRIRAIWEGLLDGARMAAPLGLLLAAVGPVSQTVMETGLGVNLSNALIISPVGKILLLALPLVMLLTILAGAALIEAATYIIMALALAPFLEEVGFDRLASHMFIYYFSVFATLTPPIAITCQAAAQIAECKMWDACYLAMKLAFVGLVVPFVFIYNPELLGFPNISVPMLTALALLVAALTLLTASFWGWFVNPLPAHDRVIFAAAGVILLVAAAQNRFDLAVLGLAIGGLEWAWQLFKRRRAVPALVGEPGFEPLGPRFVDNPGERGGGLGSAVAQGGAVAVNEEARGQQLRGDDTR